jgi:hypothetical protein
MLSGEPIDALSRELGVEGTRSSIVDAYLFENGS